MIRKLIFSLFIFSILIPNVLAKPRCELFYDDVYYQTDFPRDVDLLTDGDQKHIGIRLLNRFSEAEGGSWVLKKNKDNYYLVGKVDKSSLVTRNPYDLKKIMYGDVILEINGKDLRGTYDEKEFESYISDAYEEDEVIKIKLLRELPNKKTEVFEIETTNEVVTYNQPIIDLYVNAITLNEKQGTYDVSIEKDLLEDLPFDYNLTKAAHKHLVTKPNSDEYPSSQDIKVGNYTYEECVFQDTRWAKTNSRDPAYGLQIKNIISEDKDKRTSNYLIVPYFDTDYNGVEDQPYAQVMYKLVTTYKIRNSFNLKTFPFDKQKIVLDITNNRYDIDNWKAMPSTWTYKSGMNFIKQNAIPGWNITNFEIKYKPYEDRFIKSYFFDGFQLSFDVERKSRYYVFKIILPIILILFVCWSAVWINPKEIESRLTITIVCLLSLIAYNFVIDNELPKLEYLTIMDYIILVSYVYATIPNFLSIVSFQLIGKNENLLQDIENYGKKFGLISYLLIVFLIILINTNISYENTNSMLSWLGTMR